jgi:hypothetical protein
MLMLVRVLAQVVQVPSHGALGGVGFAVLDRREDRDVMSYGLSADDDGRVDERDRLRDLVQGGDDCAQEFGCRTHRR